MTYQCKKKLYDGIANCVTNKDLNDTKLSLHGFVVMYINNWLNLPEGTITEISTYN